MNGTETEGTKSPALAPGDLPEPPEWLGWAAAALFPLTLGIVYLPFCAWVYRYGRRKGRQERAQVGEPESWFWLRKVGGWFLLLVPLLVPGFLLGAYVIVHIPTIIYKHGYRVGAGEAAGRQPPGPGTSGL